MRVLFSKPYDHVTLRSRSGTPRATVAYQPGEVTVPREHGDAAVAGGYAVEVDAPPRGGRVTGAVDNGEKGPEVFIPAKDSDTLIYESAKRMVAEGQKRTLAIVSKASTKPKK